MRFCIFGYLFFAVMLTTSAQKSYFQQEVSNVISVSLNDQDHSLQGTIQVKYKNNSPDILDKIAFHLWPNAYSSQTTAFAKQKLNHRSTTFYDGKVSDLGSISGLKFVVNGIRANVESHKTHSDIIWVVLPSPLKPNQTIEISTPFQVQIPYSVSRLGHVGQTYQITQWYPKPAVYDHKGWHEMPYLDQGEFYSEFGSFDVNITLPKNYVVGATGSLQNPEEILFLEQMHQKTTDAIQVGKPLHAETPVSDKETKTLHYIAENVHDFAWFADKNFMVQKSQATLASGKKVETYAMFIKLGLWNEAVKYVTRSIEFYSQNVGEYPWPQATAVHSALSAGAGMEYPMITVIGDASSAKDLDDVITHEVGHNWFYGILASNEREHPYMDEGINTYYENRYLQKYYKSENRFIPQKITKFLGNNFSEKEATYLLFARNYLDQYPNQRSENFTMFNYGTDVYMKTAHLFEYAEKSIGTERFDDIMKTYYSRWKFKHPYPEDLETVFKEKIGNEADWLFSHFLSTNKKLDYKICRHHNHNQEQDVVISNKGGVPAPFTVTGMKGEEVVFENWEKGFEGRKKISIPNGDYDRIVIDQKQQSYELYRSNNEIRTKGMFKKVEPLQFSMLPIFDNPRKTEIGLVPVVGWNAYNKAMLGLHICQPIFPNRNFTMEATPMYSVGTKSIAGMAKTKYTKYFTKGFLHNISFGLAAKKFGFEELKLDDKIFSYIQLTPSIKFDLRDEPASNKSSDVEYKFHWIQDEFANFQDSTYFKDKTSNQIHQLYYTYSNPFILNSTLVKTGIQFQSYKDYSNENQFYIRADLTYTKRFRLKKSRFFEARFFGSMFLYNSERESKSISTRRDYVFTQGSIGLAYQPYSDQTNEHLFLGRTKESGLWSQQIAIQNGGFKIAPGISQANNLGNTNILLAAMNLRTDLPFKYIGGIIRPYFDVGFYEPTDKVSSKDKILMSGGINIKLPGNVLNIYLPIYHSENIKNLYKSIDNYNYWKEVTFSLNLKLPTLNTLLNSVSL
ncbi:MAG: M1 family metallopeptidase [Saprospiraceae bacterium]|nr:M1 family metallopeptidase [Saprospiraceae bacterium]